MDTQAVRMSCPAPRRCWYPTGDGGWSSRQWTVEDVKEAKRGGAWFAQGTHDFADMAAAREASRDDNS